MSTKAIRVIANVGILSPLIWIVGMCIVLLNAPFNKGLSDQETFGMAMILALLLGVPFATVLLLFPIGVALYAVLAWRLQERSRWAWGVMVLFSGLWACQSQLGIRITGIVILVLLFTLKPFRILRRGVEPICSANAASPHR